MARLAIIGTGYVGLTTGACLAHLGHDVLCADVDVDKVERLKAGQVPIVEDGLSGRLVAFDAMDMSFREYRLQRDPSLEVTWENRDRIQITELDGLCMPKVTAPPEG